MWIVLLLAAQERWAFDGETQGVQGRAEYRASAVSGKALHFNGVDTFVEGRPAESPEFTFAAWVYLSEPAAQPIASRGWVLEAGADGSIRFGGAQTTARTLFAGQWFHLAGVVSEGKSRLFVNGELAAEGVGAKGEGPLLLGKHDKRFFRGLMDEARWYDRALGADALATLVSEQLDWYRPRRRGPFEGKFELAAGDVVALVGGANLAAENETGFLETQLILGAPVRVRNLAWEGDTVFEQRRDLNFGPWKRYLERAGANVVFVQFGQMESLKGEAGLPAFRDAYAKLLDQVSERTKRVVVLSPTPFEKSEPPLPDLSLRNDDLRKYSAAARELAAARGFRFVDLLVPHRTRNGVHLTAEGLESASRRIAEELGVPKADLQATPAVRLREAIVEKNRLWFDHWRPMNWAFLEGDRTEQPSSRDHVDRKIRWFPVEMQDFLPLLRKQEARIDELLREARR